MTPNTRLEQYLNRLATDDGIIPEAPDGRIEQYLAYIINGSGPLPEKPETRIEQYLNFIATGSGQIPEPNTRIEQYLNYYATQTGSFPNDPNDRIEKYLYQIVTKEPATDNYGTLFYDDVDELVGARLEAMEEVTVAEITDFELLKRKLKEKGMYRNWCNLMYENWDEYRSGWYCYELSEYDEPINPADYGLRLEVAEGTMFTDATIELTWQESGRTGLKLTIKDETMFNQLCADGSDDTAIPIGNKIVQKKKIKKYVFGEYAPDTIGVGFLSYCMNAEIEGDLPANVTKLGANFLYQCRKFNSHLDFSHITQVDSFFLSGCTTFNQEVDFSNLITLEQGFMMSCQKFNHPLIFTSLNMTRIPSNVLRECFAFDSELSLPNTITSIGEYFLSGYGTRDEEMATYNRPITFIGKATTIAYGFMQFNKCFNQDVTLPSCLVSPAPAFMRDMKKMTSTITVNCNPSQFNNNNYFLSTNNPQDDMYVQGVKIAGPYATAFVTRFPNRTTSPYRKLVKV